MKVIKMQRRANTWCFELGDVVTVDKETEGVKEGDIFEIIDRFLDSEADELYTVQKVGGRKKWDIGASWIEFLTDEEVEKIWNELEDVTFVDSEKTSDLVLASKYFIWKKGTRRTDIWRWFNSNHSKGLQYLHNEYEG
jgi:hypothetical protein